MRALRDLGTDCSRRPGGRIAGTGAAPLIARTADGCYRLPALIDAHVHVESSHLTPRQFGRAIAAQGTLTAVCDPHEIVNVMGERGLDFMLEDAKASPADLRFSLPSCVPATPFETSGAALTAADTARLLAAHPELVSLGEMMNVPGVLAGDPEVLGKIAAAKAAGKPVDGHFPGGRGEALARYAAAGISSDHETLSADEALEKVAAGQTVFIREGSAARNLAALLPAVNDGNWERFCFCTDDVSAEDLLASGGIVNCIRKAVRLGMDPERAVALATVNPARHYGLELSDRDGVIVRDLVDFEIVRVVRDGRTLAIDPTADADLRPQAGSVRLPDLARRSFRAPEPKGGMLDVIGVNDGSLVTEHLRRAPDDVGELALLTVIERHGKNGNVASAWTARTGLRRGAIASTVAHDHHNLIVLGNAPGDVRAAAAHLARLGGGQCVVLDGEVVADLPLPVAGLMSARPAREVAAQARAVREAARLTGCTLADPFATLSFLALPVIPALKLTDLGLFAS